MQIQLIDLFMGAVPAGVPKTPSAASLAVPQESFADLLIGLQGENNFPVAELADEPEAAVTMDGAGAGEESSEQPVSEPEAGGTGLPVEHSPPAHRSHPEVDLPTAAIAHALFSNGSPFEAYRVGAAVPAAAESAEPVTPESAEAVRGRPFPISEAGPSVSLKSFAPVALPMAIPKEAREAGAALPEPVLRVETRSSAALPTREASERMQRVETKSTPALAPARVGLAAVPRGAAAAIPAFALEVNEPVGLGTKPAENSGPEHSAPTPQGLRLEIPDTPAKGVGHLPPAMRLDTEQQAGTVSSGIATISANPESRRSAPLPTGTPWESQTVLPSTNSTAAALDPVGSAQPMVPLPGAEPTRDSGRENPVRAGTPATTKAETPSVELTLARPTTIRVENPEIRISVRGGQPVPSPPPAEVALEPSAGALHRAVRAVEVLAALRDGFRPIDAAGPAGKAERPKTKTGEVKPISNSAAAATETDRDAKVPMEVRRSSTGKPERANEARRVDRVERAVRPARVGDSESVAVPGKRPATPAAVVTHETARPPELVAGRIDAAHAPPASRLVAVVDAAAQAAVQHVRNLAVSGGQTVTVRLVPDSLGELHVTITSSPDGIEIVLASSNPQVRHALEQHLPGLHESLARDGFEVAKTTVTAPVAPDSGAQASYSRAGNGHSNAPGRPAPGPQTFTGHWQAREEDVLNRNRRSWNPSGGGLNVFV